MILSEYAFWGSQDLHGIAKVCLQTQPETVSYCASMPPEPSQCEGNPGCPRLVWVQVFLACAITPLHRYEEVAPLRHYTIPTNGVTLRHYTITPFYLMVQLCAITPLHH